MTDLSAAQREEIHRKLQAASSCVSHMGILNHAEPTLILLPLYGPDTKYCKRVVISLEANNQPLT